MNDIHKEIAFERHVQTHLLESGWSKGLDADFDPKLALDAKHLLGFIKDTQLGLWDRLSKQYGDALGGLIIKDLVAMAESIGLLELLRRGLDFRGVNLRLAYFKPSFGLNPDLVAKYEKNRLLVYTQVRYEPDRDEKDKPKSIDMMLALNGLPIATVELKNPGTGQTVENAIKQYQTTRDPRAPLFKFKQRALVHFAVDPNQVYMATRLAWDDTVFLPFNKGGAKGGAGNPPNPHGHRTAYLWEEVWERDSFLDIVGRFLHLEKDEKSGKEILIFPRYHQLDVVRQLVRQAILDGAGHNYLVQHSTGSGKSNSIAWLAHRLHSLYVEQGGQERKVFDCVVVITDRRILNRQLQQTIWQIDHTPGIVRLIDKHSRQLAQALTQGAAIIVTTLQMFPYARDQIDKLPNRTYAIIADEAHSSQTGETAREMKRTLGTGVKDLMQQDYVRLGEDDGEDELRKVMESRQQQKNLSFFAFTATPKGKTLKYFGTLGPDGNPRPCHTYSMRQAIEEGFILDVLKSYTTYATFTELQKKVDEDPDVPEKAAAKALSHLYRHHAHVIGQKLEVIVEHFRTTVAAKIGGRAKAMIVTSSREAAVRYRKAFDEYVQQKGYENLEAYVAFSGVVKLDDGGEHTESDMNGVKDSELKEAFRESLVHRFLIVADKYQTGYDEPLLHTMYVDKKLADVAAVQTLSRLNRRASGKSDTFVLDFVNKAEEIQKSFQPYYETTITEGGADHTTLYRLRHELEQAQVFQWAEVEAFAKDFYVARKKVSKKQHGKWVRHLQPGVDRFVELEKKPQEEFRAKLRAYVNLYGYLSQVMGFSAKDLEILYSFGRFLLADLPRDKDEAVDLAGKVDLDTLVIDKRYDGSIGLVTGEDGIVATPSGAVGTGAANEKVSPLSEVIAKINERIGSRFGGAPEKLMESVIDGMTEQDAIGERALANKFEDFRIASDVQNGVTSTIVEHHGDNEEFVEAYLNDEEGIQTLVIEGVLREVYKRIRERDAAERGIDPVLLADIGKLRNRLEPKLRIMVKRALKMHRGDAWIRELLKVLPESRRKQLAGVDADTILREHTYLLDLITLIHTRWSDYFQGFEAGSPKSKLSREQVKVLLDYVNTHREDAHAGALEEAELATLKIVVTALERAVDRQLED